MGTGAAFCVWFYGIPFWGALSSAAKSVRARGGGVSTLSGAKKQNTACTFAAELVYYNQFCAHGPQTDQTQNKGVCHEDHYCGDGKVGLALTRQLLHEGHEVTIVDSNPVVLQANMYQYDVMAVQGNAATMEALRQALVEKADLLIAATSADEINLLCCLTAKKMNSRLHTIARVRNPDYTEQLFFMREELGLSMTINPELSAAREIFHLLQFPSFLHRTALPRAG